MNFILWSPYRNECDKGTFQKAYKNVIFQVILKFDSNENMVASWSIWRALCLRGVWYTNKLNTYFQIYRYYS